MSVLFFYDDKFGLSIMVYYIDVLPEGYLILIKNLSSAVTERVCQELLYLPLEAVKLHK